MPRPRATSSFHPVAGGGVLFDAAQGRLYALNPPAGITWLCLRDGLSGRDCALALASAFNVDASTAAEWFRISWQSFADLDLFETTTANDERAAAAPRPDAPAAARSVTPRQPWREYRLFSQLLRISAPSGPLALVESLLGALRSDPEDPKQPPAAATEIEIAAAGDRWNLMVDGELQGQCATASVAPEVEQVVVRNVVPATPHLLTLHAAVLQRDRRSLLLSGLSGAGKTTLSLALARAGWTFGSDEIVLLGRDRVLRALPLPPCIKSSAFALVGSWFPALRDAPEHERFGHTVKYLPIRSEPVSGSAGLVVFVRYGADGRTEIQPVDRFAGLERLLTQCVFVPAGFQHDDVAQLLRWHGEQHYYELTFCDADEAVAALTSLWKAPELPA